MDTWVAGRFSDIAATKLGQEIWAFLNEKESLVKLETATKLRHPAVEAIGSDLVSSFGNEIHDDRYKQATGAMVRQIMESLGYHIDQQNVVIRNNALFTRGTRYTT